MTKKRESRVIKDANGFYRLQVRFLPLEDWEKYNDGWRTCAISETPYTEKWSNKPIVD